MLQATRGDVGKEAFCLLLSFPFMGVGDGGDGGGRGVWGLVMVVVVGGGGEQYYN